MSYNPELRIKPEQFNFTQTEPGVLVGGFVCGGPLFHVTALGVRTNDDGCQEGVTPEAESQLSDLYVLTEASEPFQAIEINGFGGEYVLFGEIGT